MKQITWQFVTTDEPVSAVIRWKTDSEISHVNVVTPEGKLLGALLKGGVQVRERNYDKFALQIFVTVPVTDQQYDDFWKFADAQIGKKYDSKGIVGISFGNNLHHPDEVFCSEMQAQGVVAAKIIWIAKDTSKIDPETLRLLLTAIPGASEQRVQ